MGKNHIDRGVVLNATSGRSIRGIKALALGSQARVRSGTVLYKGARIGKHFETGHNVVVREENTIGDFVSIWNNSTIDYGCQIGNRTKIHCNVYVAQYSILEDDVFLAPGVILANDLFPGSAYSMKVLRGPILKKGAQIGINCTILPGVIIGEGAIVGAGSVVTRSVPAHTVAIGNPARFYKKKSALEWPNDFRPALLEGDRLYQATLKGKRVYPPPAAKGKS